MLYYIINKYHFGSFIIVFSDLVIAYDDLNKHGNGKTWEYRISL